jgi:hypothetical protein
MVEDGAQKSYYYEKEEKGKRKEKKCKRGRMREGGGEMMHGGRWLSGRRRTMTSGWVSLPTDKRVMH